MMWLISASADQLVFGAVTLRSVSFQLKGTRKNLQNTFSSVSWSGSVSAIADISTSAGISATASVSFTDTTITKLQLGIGCAFMRFSY